ncbi:hypothetical protein [Agromyces salentinus]|uniref:Helix-turn-helix domain-containing protein n=1 Tax=Agromyces salentinus TaxID=269421 RepID=A0ABN2MV50_9MICO|nr:hypothetical protein [Agromyces salentinus]
MAALPRSYRLNPADRLVLFALACDSFDGIESAPGADALAAWAGMFPSSVYEILSRLSAATADRPALVERSETRRGRHRTVYRLLVDQSGIAGEFEEPAASVVAQVRGAKADERSAHPTGEPSGERSGVAGELPSLSLPSIPPTPLTEPIARVLTPQSEEGSSLEQARATDYDADARDRLKDIPLHLWAWAESRRPIAHEHEGFARRKLARMGLPLPLNELLEHAYRLGAGNPWPGAQIIAARADRRPLTGASDPTAVLRSRLAQPVERNERPASMAGRQ